MSILQCGMLLSILSYQLLVIAVAQNACIYSADTEGICRPYADCQELHHKVIFHNDDCEANTYCCPNNVNNDNPALKPNHENPPLPDNLKHTIWGESEEDPNQPPFDNTPFIPVYDYIEIPLQSKPDFNDDGDSNPIYVQEVFNDGWDSNPTYKPEVGKNPNIFVNVPWNNVEQLFPPKAVPGVQVYTKVPQPHNPRIIGQTTPKPITTTTTEAIPFFDAEFYRRLGLAFGNKYNPNQQPDVVTPQSDVETSTVNVTIEEVTTHTASVMSNLNQVGLFKLSSQKCGFVHIENDPSESNAEAHLLEFPWLALLRYESGSRIPNFSCGGSLITERWVLTAASCIQKTLIGVRLGEYKISTKSNKDCVRNLCSVYKDYKIAITVKHADYKPETGVKDIALIKLKAKVEMTKNIKTICLPTKDEYFNVPYDNTPLTISGWGLNKTGAAEVLKKHAINRSKSGVCQQALPEHGVHQSKLCLTTRYEEPSTCSGDNGGPIIWLVNDNTQFFTQIGVVPFGMDKCGAADGIVSAYYVESVADSMDWITKVIAEDE